MSTKPNYKKLDAIIVNCIKDKKNPIYNFASVNESRFLATLSDCDPYRITDARLQYLRRIGVIIFSGSGKNRIWRLI